MKREELLQVLHQMNITACIADGPTALLLTSGGQTVAAAVKLCGETLVVTTGRLWKRCCRIPLSELQ